MFRMARSNPELSELEWDPSWQAYKAKEGLFPTNQYLNSGVSVYLDELLKFHEIDLSLTFDSTCYPSSKVDYTHVARVPLSALEPTDNQKQLSAGILKDPKEACEAGKAHALIRPLSSDEKAARRAWKQIRQRLISRATTRPKNALEWNN